MQNPQFPVVRRDLRFEPGSVDLRTWHPDGLHVAHFFNALSIFFPEGETFFIRSVRRFADRIRDPRLRRDVEGFVGQEAIHGREHRRYNEALAAAGFPVDALEDTVRQFLRFLGRYTPAEHQLAVTIALEHFTAIMADAALSDEAVFANTHPALASMWRWHAIEETEHKAVAYDVYEEVCGRGPLAYVRRTGVMLLASVTFWGFVLVYHFRLVHADGKATDLAGWGRLARFSWLSPGFLRKLVRPWLEYFRPGFHPWRHDNSALVERWKAAYESTGHVPA